MPTFDESEHPRDDDGKFTNTGAKAWAGKKLDPFAVPTKAKGPEHRLGDRFDNFGLTWIVTKIKKRTGRGRGADPSYEYQMLQEERDAFGKPGNRTQVFIERDLQPGAGFRKIDK